MTHLRALLLTDVVDSTELSLRVGDAEMAGLWIAHDRAARDLLAAAWARDRQDRWHAAAVRRGRGRAWPTRLTYQQALKAARLPLQGARGLHVGPVIVAREQPCRCRAGAKPIEVEGVAKPTAARVMSLAQGGQTLLTARR